MATLIVRRHQARVDKRAAYEIWLDGVSVGRLRQEQELELETFVGPHVLQARAAWVSSEPLRFEQEGAAREIEVEVNLRGARLVLVTLLPPLALVRRQRYLALRVVR